MSSHLYPGFLIFQPAFKMITEEARRKRDLVHLVPLLKPKVKRK
jgi:hypothetical protein